jgi:hypothetical protein
VAGGGGSLTKQQGMGEVGGVKEVEQVEPGQVPRLR